jgi:hypothetical protein
MSVSLYGSGQTVIQVVTATWNTQVTTTSASFVTTGFSATITPQSTTSKILCVVNLNGCQSGNGTTGGQHTLYKGGSNVVTTGQTFNCLAFAQNAATGLYTSINYQYLDSPATTAATTYTTYMCTQGGTVSINTTGISSINLIEIAYA